MKRWIAGFTMLVLLAGFTPVFGAMVEFVPPNDPTGSVFTVNSNDGYDDGRGVVFEMTSDQTISSVGIYHDLRAVSLSFEVAETIATSGQVTAGQTILRSGVDTITTAGLEWIDFAISPLLLQTGNSYHIEFTHSGIGVQNFFYNNNNVVFSQDGFSLLDGTRVGHTSNFVMPAIRVNTGDVIPEPATVAIWSLLVLCGIGIGWRRCRKG